MTRSTRMYMALFEELGAAHRLPNETDYSLGDFLARNPAYYNGLQYRVAFFLLNSHETSFQIN